jgi:hypothetical protein
MVMVFAPLKRPQGKSGAANGEGEHAEPALDVAVAPRAEGA